MSYRPHEIVRGPSLPTSIRSLVAFPGHSHRYVKISYLKKGRVHSVTVCLDSITRKEIMDGKLQRAIAVFRGNIVEPGGVIGSRVALEYASVKHTPRSGWQQIIFLGYRQEKKATA